MKTTTHIIALIVSILVCIGCEDIQEPMKWVDLRYDVPQDSYLIDKDGKDTVKIRVRSTEPWTVYGMKGESWYKITPDSGNASEIYTVTITCEANTSLDDRRDTIVIRSDYWTGKEFLLTQKGTAYLDYQEPADIAMDGESLTLEVLSNQDWRAEVTSGSTWLGISSGATGNGDSAVMLTADENKGEQRTAEVTLYDRNGDVRHVVTMTQIGIVLSPSAPENGAYHMLYHESQQIRIPVESNVTWKVEKKSPEDEGWYEIEGGNEFEGPDELIINVSEYAVGGASAVREGNLILSTVPEEEGGFSLVKTIRFKQASPDANRTQSNEGKVLDAEGLRSEDGIPAGRYTFYLSPFTAADCIYLYFFWQREGTSFAELRFWLNTTFAPGKTELSCMPYCNDVNKWQNNLLVGFDSSKPVKIALDIRESQADASGNTWIYSEWWLNDKKIAQATSDGITDRDGATDTWKVRYSDTIGTGYFKIWAFSGSADLEKWEYTSPIIWGD